MDRNNRNKSILLSKIEKTHFVIWELRLYLDTHPTDMQAIKHYRYYENRLEELTKEYEKIYGPVTPKFTVNGDRWAWCDGPWPWETECNQYN